MALLDRLAAEWPLISAAPYTFSLVLLATLMLAAWGAHLWNRREMNAIKAEKQSADAATKLAEKQRDVYKDESDNYRRELEKTKTVPATALPVILGNAAVKAAFANVSTAPMEPVIFYGNEAQWSDPELTRYAAYQRLQKEGLVEMTPKSPDSTVVHGTSAALKLRQYFDDENIDFFIERVDSTKKKDA